MAQIPIDPISEVLQACADYEEENPDEAPLSVEDCLKQVCVADNDAHETIGETEIGPYPDCDQHTETGRASFRIAGELDFGCGAACPGRRRVRRPVASSLAAGDFGAWC